VDPATCRHRIKLQHRRASRGNRPTYSVQ
jgi:hypothetical protein